MLPARYRRSASRAFTLVELLVAIAIIGVLVALLLPAVQAARAAARRTGCLNNLHQLGIALASHHAAQRQLPIGCLEWRPPSGQDERQLAWCVWLLPELEAQSVYDRLDTDKAFDSPTNASAAATVLAAFICPAGQRGERLGQSRGPTDYGGIFGERITGPLTRPNGAFVHEVAVRYEQVTDGLSATLAVGEDVGFPDGQWINGRNLFDQSDAPINTAPAFENDLRSDHPGGACALWLDGQARLIASDIDPLALAALCTRDGAEAKHAE